MRFQYVIHGDEAYMFNGDERQAIEREMSMENS